MALDAMQVVYTRGPLLWQGFTVLGNSLNKRKLAPRSNAPSQEYNPADRSVINRATILGGVSVEASGTYAPVVSYTQSPSNNSCSDPAFSGLRPLSASASPALLCTKAQLAAEKQRKFQLKFGVCL